MNQTTDQCRLIQEIDEDVLGTVHCAAWKTGEDPEEIMLVRLFDSAGIDPEKFLEQVASRQDLVGAQISDHLMTSRQLGVVQGQAFELLPYVSGKSLASLLRQATGHRQAFPIAVALFIVGRVATGLSAAYRHGIDGRFLLHGFVTPHMIRISEEGKVALCGLETAPALRDLRGTASTFTQVLPYLAPESTTDEEPHRSDDVYSLGALLYELLTLQPLASSADLHLENPKIPAELGYFLNRSVAPRFRRIQSVIQWVQELKTLVIQEGWVASAQDLAAFIASIDERLRPLKPDTSEISADDREALAQAIQQTRAEQTDQPQDRPHDTEKLDVPLAVDVRPPKREVVFQTMAVPTNIIGATNDEDSLAR